MNDSGEALTETSGDGDGDGDGGDGDGDPATGDGDGEGEALRPNWHQDLAPLVHENCVACHVDGGIAPFSLETYEQASAWAELVREAVDARAMPPWGAEETEECQPPHSWRNDMRLSDEEIALIDDWVDAGTPEGDPAEAAPLPEPLSLNLDNPSVELSNPSPYVVGGTSDSFPCMVVDPGHTEDVWLTGVQNIPDNDLVVHHVLTYIDTNGASDALVDADGKFECPGGFVNLNGAVQISTWVPGGVPTETPEGVGFPMPVGAKIIMAYHYHPTGAGDEVDQSGVALRWTTEEPEVAAYAGLAGVSFTTPASLLPGENDPGPNPLFEIPAGASGHVETVAINIPALVPPIDMFSIGTHMHYAGVDMKIWIERDGEEICLLHTPRYDFNWQRLYDVDAPVGEMPQIQGGDTLYLRCTYDNTLDNPLLAEALGDAGLDAPVDVGPGEQTLDEMCLILFGVASNLPVDQFF